VFDPATIVDRSTYDDPHQYPAGVRTVIVNGTVVIDGGEQCPAGPAAQAAGNGASVMWVGRLA
jgi:N-acyl-D-amino-acid deacylase